MYQEGCLLHQTRGASGILSAGGIYTTEGGRPKSGTGVAGRNPPEWTTEHPGWRGGKAEQPRGSGIRTGE